MAPDKSEDGAQHFLVNLVSGYSYPILFNLHFTCLFHSQLLRPVAQLYGQVRTD